MQADDSDVEVGEEDARELEGEFPTANAAAVAFGWEDKRPLTGRRLKAAKDKQKKAKSGSFGEFMKLLAQHQSCDVGKFA